MARGVVSDLRSTATTHCLLKEQLRQRGSRVGPALTHWEASSPPHFLLHTASPQQAASSDTCFPIVLIFPAPTPWRCDILSSSWWLSCIMGTLSILIQDWRGEHNLPMSPVAATAATSLLPECLPRCLGKGSWGGRGWGASLSPLIPLTQDTGLQRRLEILESPG